MLTQRPSAKHSTSVPQMEPEVWLSTAFSAPTAHSSTRTTSSATGGLILIVPLPRISTLSMMKLLLSVKLLLEMMLSEPMVLLLSMLQVMLLLMTTLQKADVVGDLETAEGTTEGEEDVEDSEVELDTLGDGL